MCFKENNNELAQWVTHLIIQFHLFGRNLLITSSHYNLKQSSLRSQTATHLRVGGSTVEEREASDGLGG